VGDDVGTMGTGLDDDEPERVPGEIDGVEGSGVRAFGVDREKVNVIPFGGDEAFGRCGGDDFG
jgi:hypothetical protein